MSKENLKQVLINDVSQFNAYWTQQYVKYTAPTPFVFPHALCETDVSTVYILYVPNGAVTTSWSNTCSLVKITIHTCTPTPMAMPPGENWGSVYCPRTLKLTVSVREIIEFVDFLATACSSIESCSHNMGQSKVKSTRCKSSQLRRWILDTLKQHYVVFQPLNDCFWFIFRINWL